MRCLFSLGLCLLGACARAPVSSETPTRPQPSVTAELPEPSASAPLATAPSVQQPAETAPASIVLAKNQAGPTAIALDEKNVYWIDEGTGDEASGAIMSLPKGSRDEPRVLAKSIAMPLGLAVGPAGVFFTDAGAQGSLTDPKPRGRVVALPFGKPAQTLASAEWGPRGIALHGSDLFFTTPGVVEGQPSSVMKVPQKGGNATALASKEFGPFSVVASDAGVYFIAQNDSCSTPRKDGALRMLPHKGGVPRDVSGGLACPEGLVLRGGFAYVTSTGDGRVVGISLASGDAKEIAGGEHMPRSVAADDARVYWIAFHDAALRSAPLDGGKAETLVEKGASGGVAVDASGVYFTDTSSGTVSFVPAADRQKK